MVASVWKPALALPLLRAAVVLGAVGGAPACSREPDITDCAVGPIVVSDAAGVDKLSVPCVQGDVEVKGNLALAEWSRRETKPRYITGALKLSLSHGEGSSLSLSNLRRADIQVFSGAPFVIDAPQLVEGSVAGNASVTLRAPVFVRGTVLHVVDATLPSLTTLERLDVPRAPFSGQRKASVSLPALVSVKTVTVEGDAVVDLGAALPTELVQVMAADLSGLGFLQKLKTIRRSLVVQMVQPGAVTFPELREVGEVRIDGASSIAFDQLERAGDVRAGGAVVTFDAPQLVQAGDVELNGSALARVHLPALRSVATLSVVGSPALTALALPSLETVRGRGLEVRSTGLTTLDLPTLTTVSSSLALLQNEMLTTLSVPALIFSHDIVIRGSPALRVQTDHLRSALAPGATLTACDTAAAQPCAWTPVGTRLVPFQTATGSENLRQSMTAGVYDSSGAIQSSLPKAPYRQIVGTTNSFAAVLASATGAPTVMASGVLNHVSGVPKSVRTWAVPPLTATPTTLFVPFYSTSAAFNPMVTEPPQVALLVVVSNPAKVNPTKFTLYALVKDKLISVGSGQVTTDQAARADFFGFGTGTEIQIQHQELEKQPLIHIVHARNAGKLPVVFSRTGTAFVLDEALLSPLPPPPVILRWVAAAAAMAPPEAPPDQTEAAATTSLGACRIALALPACPEGSITHTTKTETFCTRWEGANAPRVGRALEYEASDCAEMVTATTKPFVRVLRSGTYENGVPTGTWFSWQESRGGAFFLSSAIQYRDGELHGSVVNCGSDGSCTSRRFFNGASVGDAG